jgi:hypothetical protein
VVRVVVVVVVVAAAAVVLPLMLEVGGKNENTHIWVGNA